MNDTDVVKNIYILAQEYRNILINISDFVKLISKETFGNANMNVAIDRELLATGLYATISECNIYIAKIATPKYVRVSNKTVVSSKDLNDWSPEVVIDDSSTFELSRLFNLKLYW